MNTSNPRAIPRHALMATAVFSSCQMMAFVLYPYLSESTGLPMSSIIGSFSVGSFLFLWGSPYWTRRSQRNGSKKVLAVGVIGLLLSQIVLLALIHADEYLSASAASGLLWASRILYGLTASAIVPVSQSILAQASQPTGRMQALTRHTMALHAGRLLGPLIVWIGFLIATDVPLWISVAVLISLLSLILSASSEPSDIPVHRKRERVDRFWLLQNARLLGIALLLTILVGTLQSSLTLHIQTTLKQSAGAAAQLTLEFLLVASLITLLVQALVQKHIKNPWQGTLPAGALCLALSCFLLMILRNEWQLWCSLPLFAVGIALVTPSYTAAFSLQGSFSQQGDVAGIVSVTHTLGYALGGLLSAVLIAFHSSPLPISFLLSSALLLLAFMVKAPADVKLKNLTRDHA